MIDEPSRLKAAIVDALNALPRSVAVPLGYVVSAVWPGFKDA